MSVSECATAESRVARLGRLPHPVGHVVAAAADVLPSAADAAVATRFSDPAVTSATTATTGHLRLFMFCPLA